MSVSALSLGAAALGLATTSLVAPTTAAIAQQALPTPEAWFGHRMGTDGFLEPYDKMVSYYRQLEKSSNRIKVVEIGKSTEGRPYLAMYISSPENLARLEEYRQMNLKLADPRGVPQAELDRIVREGKPVIAQSYDLHSTEIGSSLTAVEFTYNMVSKTDAATMNVLNNVILVMLPSINPDGHEYVQQYYMKYKGTSFEGGPVPYLYQKYVGHDNNRDAFMMNLSESKALGKLLFVDWKPEAYIDHHQMGSYGPRIVIPPYADPIRPDADPLVWREEQWFGAEMAANMDAAKLPGAIGNAIYSGWGHFGFHWITPFHNTAGMLDESASANIASPLYIHPDQIADTGNQRNVPDNRPQMNMPDPWKGGWWRPRDIVERQLVTSWSVVDMAARNREMLLRNAILKAQRQTDRGAAGEVKAFILDINQHDPLTVTKLANSLIEQGVDVYRAPAQFVQENRVYPAGTYVVPMNQPNMGLIRYLLGRTFFPDDLYARTRDGTPIRPYDMSTDTQNEFMGVEATPTGIAVTANMEKLTGPVTPRGTVAAGGTYLLDGALNDSFHATNLALKQGATVRRVERASGNAKAGDFIVTGLSQQAAQSIATTTGVNFAAGDSTAGAGAIAMKMPRIGMLKRWRGGNIDEGWTRLLFETYEFPYNSVMDAEIKAGNLIKKYDVIVLPSDSVGMMTGEGGGRAGGGGLGGGGNDAFPPEFRSGFGEEGIKALDDFVKAGGRIVTFGEAGNLAIEKFRLPVRNVVAGLPTKQFWSPGSTLNINVANDTPLGYGMPNKALAIYTQECQVYEAIPSMHNERVDVIASYAQKDILRSGWLLGEDIIVGKAAAVAVQHGRGDVVMLGFRAQHRSQAHGTYKLVFDAIYDMPMRNKGSFGAAPGAASGS
ncbi:M14 family zinc carboxypeptidase [Sphingomonas quercus]|nr:M14 family zinc carboxypeptidase [Sphingomonas quercus]